jgi:iron(III) transport system ATP-binding protein
MSAIELRDAGKAFGATKVLDGVSLSVPERSITAVLGASGSGKTTLLRLIAGFEALDRGTLTIGDRLVDDGSRSVPAQHRGVGYVPQEGALFPHLSVGRNVAFGLARGEGRRARVEGLLELVGLAGLGRRHPHQLSGGQQQRVALARALASDPEIVLLDEPFSSLDASLRASVRADVHDVLRKSGATTILVTHDQDEALSMADQVAILRGGVIAQVSTPSGLYGAPRDAELAQFLGDANLVEGTAHGATVTTALGELEVAPRAGGDELAAVMENLSVDEKAYVDEKADVIENVSVMVRPEQLLLGDAGTSALSGFVRSYEYFGHDAVVRVQPEDGGLPELVVRITGGTPLAPGTRVGLSVHGAVVVWPRTTLA